MIGPLVRDYRRAPVRHADETGWRTDGRNGYAGLFCPETISLFRFRGSRSAQVADRFWDRTGCAAGWWWIVIRLTTVRPVPSNTVTLICCATGKTWKKSSLDRLAQHPATNLYKLLFRSDSS